jgi:NADH:ubiquinone reductase (H+-translocating)
VTPSPKHVVIVGAGFAGLGCARKLAGHSDVRITLIDKNNYQQFQPLLYQVATATLSPDNAAFGLRSVLRHQSNVEFKMAEVASADLSRQTVKTTDGREFQGDFLVLAAGSEVNFFGTPGTDKHVFPLYSLRDAEILRTRLLQRFESADRDPSVVAKGELNVVVVGAGPTGVETAGVLGDLRRTIPKDVFRSVELDSVQISLVNKEPEVLSAFSEKSQHYAAKKLKERGVQLRLGAEVKEVTSEGVLLADGTRIPARTVIWAGGLKASSLSSALGLKLGRGGRIDVQPDFTIAGFPRVYALGDFANIAGKDGNPLPQLASVALEAGKYCAKHIAARIAGEQPKPFDYFDRGIMAMIGRGAAIAELGSRRHELTGPIAFAAWLGVHALLLTTTRAKVETFIEWAWDYFSRVPVDPVLDRPNMLDLSNDDEEDDVIRKAS